MADACHWRNRGDCGGASPCPSDCLGAFTDLGRFFGPLLRPGDSVVLKMCERHETAVWLVRGKNGNLYVSHEMPWPPPAR